MYKSVYYWNHCGLELWSSFFSGVIQNFLWLLFSMSQRVDYWYYCWVDHNCQYYWDTGKSVSSVKSPRNCKSWDPISWIHATTPRNFFRTHIKSDSDWISHICVCGLFLFVSSFCIPLLLWKPYFRMSVLKPLEWGGIITGYFCKMKHLFLSFVCNLTAVHFRKSITTI